MACFSAKSKHFSSSCKNTMLVIFVILALIGSCSATRLGKSMMMVMKDKVSMNDLEHTKEFNPKKHETGFRYRGQIFSYFPKGTPIPPSGPSQRHNAVVDSAPGN